MMGYLALYLYIVGMIPIGFSYITLNYNTGITGRAIFIALTWPVSILVGIIIVILGDRG